MKVLSVSTGSDTGGGGINLTKAFRQFASKDIEFRSIRKSNNYIQYPTDLPWSKLAEYWIRADIAHIHSSTAIFKKLEHKKFVIHHHGTKYRNHSEALNKETIELGGEAVVSTIDLLDYGENLTWIPLAQSLPTLAAYRNPLHGTKLRVGHSPTDRSVKNTEEFLAACKKIGINPVLIERKSWNQCLAMKGTVDIFYDQVGLGYGNSAIEAWAMGIPVICGAADSTLARMRNEFGEIPFYEATGTVDSIADAISALSDESTRNEYRIKGAAHAKRWHNGEESVRRLIQVYQRVLDRD